jgi:serpin B
LLNADALDTNTLLVLTNALYFKADWLQPFPAEDTRDGPFHLPDGVDEGAAHAPARHPRLRRSRRGAIVRLPHVDPDYAFDAGAVAAAGEPLATAEMALQPDGMAKWTEAAKVLPVLVTLPRFHIEAPSACPRRCARSAWSR